jgi:hypothetical protein
LIKVTLGQVRQAFELRTSLKLLTLQEDGINLIDDCLLIEEHSYLFPSPVAVARGEPVGEENGREEAEIGRCSQQHGRMPQV